MCYRITLARCFSLAPAHCCAAWLALSYYFACNPARMPMVLWRAGAVADERRHEHGDGRRWYQQPHLTLTREIMRPLRSSRSGTATFFPSR